MNQAGTERGVALVLVLLATAMLSAIAIGLVLSSALARLSAANHDESLALLNACESALELAARDLAALPLTGVLTGSRTSSLIDGVPGPRTIGSTTLNLDALTNQLTCGRATPCSDAQRQAIASDRPWGPNNPRWRLFLHDTFLPPWLPRPTPAIYVIVWIGDDARETDGNPSADGEGAGLEGRYVVRARAEAFGPRGGRRAIEAELARLCAETAAGETCVPGSRVVSWRAMVADVP